MTMFESIFLGALQGLTEFLPVSSSGHLVIVEHFLGVTLPAQDMLNFDIILHAGSLLAIMLCYAAVWKKLVCSLWNKDRQMHTLLLSIIIATLPAAIAGFLFQDMFAAMFSDVPMVGYSFIFTGLVLVLNERMPLGTACVPPPLHSLLIGIAQAVSIVPGISRSGMTIATGRSLGLSREGAVDFSFLMAAPIIAGASLLPLKDALSTDRSSLQFSFVAAGFLASFVVSMFAIMFLRMWVRRYSLAWFSLYLFPVGLILIFV